jgi:hypothetical protein
MSVCLSACISGAFREIWCCEHLWKSLEKIQICLKWDKNVDHHTWISVSHIVGSGVCIATIKERIIALPWRFQYYSIVVIYDIYVTSRKCAQLTYIWVCFGSYTTILYTVIKLRLSICSEMYSYNKTNEIHWFLKFIFVIELLVSERFSVHHQEFSTVYTAIGICPTG